MKPCPFCGNKELRKINAGWGIKAPLWFVVCEPDHKLCGVQGPIRDTQGAATRAWNKRKSNSTTTEKNE